MPYYSSKDFMEHNQIIIYFAAVAVGAGFGLISPYSAMEEAINSALAFMLFATFLQVPMADLSSAFARFRFIGSLLTANFVAVPVIVWLLVQFSSTDPLVRLGILMVLLTPCIDYVVTFSHLGHADARLLLAATPLLLVVQMLLLPLYLLVFLGQEAADLIRIGPFVHAFVWLIAVPFVFAVAVQFWSKRTSGSKVEKGFGLLPVPATALVLFLVIASVVPQIGPAIDASLRAVPIYVAFAVIGPIAGWLVSQMFKLEPAAGRSVAFSMATRNSLVILPLALAVPDAAPVLPAVIVTQTLVELLAELIYIRVMPKLGRESTSANS